MDNFSPDFNPPDSPNFSFLPSDLARAAIRAEKYVFDDPVTSLICQRQFAEWLARHAAARHGIETVDEKFADTLDLLKRNEIIHRPLRGLFDWLRMKGNQANHEGSGTRQEALQGLSTSHHLAVWFHRTFSDPLFNTGPYLPPPNPADAESDLREQLESFREEATRFQQQLSVSKGENDQLEKIKYDLERKAEGYQRNLIESRSLLQFVEQQQEVERRQYEKKLNKLRDEARTSTSETLQRLLDRSRSAARYVGLENAYELPLAQIRIVGPSRSRCCKTATLLVETHYTGGVSACCSACGAEEQFTLDEFRQLDLWVSCPGCKVRMRSRKRDRRYGYECPECDWRCLLSSLLPYRDDVVATR